MLLWYRCRPTRRPRHAASAKSRSASTTAAAEAAAAARAGETRGAEVEAAAAAAAAGEEETGTTTAVAEVEDLASIAIGIGIGIGTETGTRTWTGRGIETETGTGLARVPGDRRHREAAATFETIATAVGASDLVETLTFPARVTGGAEVGLAGLTEIDDEVALPRGPHLCRRTRLLIRHPALVLVPTLDRNRRSVVAPAGQEEESDSGRRRRLRLDGI